tara:strand:- start:187 stop:639 length:453 start_codon:yes stop_codon:yes gene_type:complete
MKIKTFRGLLADGDVQKIRLSTNRGEVGYMVKKFEAFPYSPTDDNAENVLFIFKQKDDATNAAADGVDFSAPGLLGALYISNHGGEENTFVKDTVIIDHVKFNQDIYVTSKIKAGAVESSGINYYIELEQMKLDQNEATVATLKDMRGRE